MALTFLPEEMLELVADKLTVRDLLSCSAVCADWRNKFNCNIFWKKHCLKGIKDYLETIPCNVEPVFKPPDSVEDRLEPLCEWRTHFMRNIHLYNNWRSKKFTMTKFRNYEGVTSSEIQTDGEGVHWLFVTTDAKVEVWNVNSSPEYFASVPLFPNCPNINLFVSGKRLVVTQWNLTSVYNLQNSKPFNILYKFAIEESLALPENLWESVDKNEINFINEVDEFRFTNFGNLFIGYKRIPNPQTESSMHIWDLMTGNKLKIVSMTHSLGEVYEIAFTNIFTIDSYRGLIHHTFRLLQHVMCSQLFVFDFKKLAFAKTAICHPGTAVWCGCSQNIIVTFTSSPGLIRFYNYSTGNLLSMKDIGQYTNSEQMQLVDSHLLYCMFNCMNVMDVRSQEVVYCLEFSFYSFVRRLTVIQPRFVVVWLLERGGRPGCPSYSQEVWDLLDLRRMVQCPSELGQEMACCSPSLIKQVISHGAMLYLYTFW